jgi:hypothetical protein
MQTARSESQSQAPKYKQPKGQKEVEKKAKPAYDGLQRCQLEASFRGGIRYFISFRRWDYIKIYALTLWFQAIRIVIGEFVTETR